MFRKRQRFRIYRKNKKCFIFHELSEYAQIMATFFPTGLVLWTLSFHQSSLSIFPSKPFWMVISSAAIFGIEETKVMTLYYSLCVVGKNENEAETKGAKLIFWCLYVHFQAEFFFSILIFVIRFVVWRLNVGMWLVWFFFVGELCTGVVD